MQQDNTKRLVKLFTKGRRCKKLLLWLGTGALFIAVVILLAIVYDKNPVRTESYKDSTGAAGLNATIDYDCRKDCEQKFNFNVYILHSSDGKQAAVTMPDKYGHVRLALPAGEYIMLIGRQLGKDKPFPQEHILLKNGKELELKLHYKGGGL